VVIDGAFGPFSPSETAALLRSIREEMVGRTLVVSVSDPQLAAEFDSVLSFDGSRLADTKIGAPERVVGEEFSDTVGHAHERVADDGVMLRAEEVNDAVE